MDEQVLRQIEKIIGYKFSKPNLLSMAFTHSSTVDDRLLSNERLEFLGDAILGAVVCEDLYKRFPNHSEGELTTMKSTLVSRQSCTEVAKQLGLQKFLKTGKGMSYYSQALPDSLIAGLLEAVIAAIYADGGLEPARDFIIRAFDSLITQTDTEQISGDYKSLLQQYAQQQFNTTPVYILLDEKGPDHNKCFESEVVLADNHFQSAWGTNKKEAEQKAAFNALVELGVLKPKQDKF